MNPLERTALNRRTLLAGLLAGGALALPGCQGFDRRFSLTDAVRRLLYLSSERAFARMTAPGGFWDQSVTQLGLESFLGTRGNILEGILTSALFKDRLEDAFADIAIEASDRAAPIVTDAVRVIGIDNALALVRGGPTAATQFLRGGVGDRLVEAMIPEVGQAMRVAQDPLMGQLLSALTGVDVGRVASSFSATVNDVIWREIGREEAAIRANPAETRDPLIIGVLGAGAAL